MTNDEVELLLEGEKIRTRHVTNIDAKKQRGKLQQTLPRLLYSLIVVVTVVLFIETLSKCVQIPSDSQFLTFAKHQRNRFNESKANYLEREVRVLCWIMTNPKNHKTRAVHVKKTWGRRCTKLLFVTTQEDDELDTLVIDIVEKYEHLWGKTRSAFKYLYEQHLNEFDWFMKADDDTYVFMENLRYMLYPFSPDMPIWFGFNFKLGSTKHRYAYMSGGSGYTLSREALRRFGDIALKSPAGCKLNDDTGAEDAEMGICLKAANVLAGDARDVYLKQRYHIFNPDGNLIANLWPKDFWYQKMSFYHTHLSRDSLSDYAVAFHYISPEDMHLYEYLKYEFEVAGVERAQELLPKKLRADEVVIPASDNDRE